MANVGQIYHYFVNLRIWHKVPVNPGLHVHSACPLSSRQVPPFIQRLGKHDGSPDMITKLCNVYLRIWHNIPVNPGLHVHSVCPLSSRQVPPFIQRLGKHDGGPGYDENKENAIIQMMY